jgi:peroxiredoxin
LAEVVAISTDEAQELRKMDELLGGTFTLLSDPNLKVISAYQMEHQMGLSTVGNMGYVIVDRNGKVKKHQVDPLFGQHADSIIQTLKELE